MCSNYHKVKQDVVTTAKAKTSVITKGSEYRADGGILYRIFSAAENSAHVPKSKMKIPHLRIVECIGNKKGTRDCKILADNKWWQTWHLDARELVKHNHKLALCYLMRHQHNRARRKTQTVLRWLTQAQLRMEKVPHLPSKNEGEITQQVEIRKSPPRTPPPPCVAMPTGNSTELVR